MQTQHTVKTVIITTLIFVFGGSPAFAHGGWGNGGNESHMRGYEGHMKGYGPGWGKGDDNSRFSEEEAEKLDKIREKFYTDTKKLRRNIREKRIDLRDEMAKDDPDTNKILAMQKEISKLQAEFDQKAVQHRLELQKVSPKKFKGRGLGRGYARGGHCWE